MSVTRDEIKVRLRTLLEGTKRGSASAIEFTDATAFAELQFDSLALMELAYDVEEAFQLTIADEELAALKTVGQLIDLVEVKTRR